MREAIVATFNVRHCRGLDGHVDLARTARVISSSRADLVALQEVDRFLARSGSQDQPLLLSELAGMKVEFCATTRRDGGEYGIAVASSGDLDEMSYGALPRLGDEEPRGAIRGRFRGLGFLATHLATQRGPRSVQLASLAELASRIDPPAVVLGDLNCPPRALGPLRRAGYRPAGRLATRPGRLHNQIDHVLAGPGVEPADAATVLTDASDHLPLVVRLRYP